MSKNPNDLTPDEVKFLKSSQVPSSIRNYLSRQHENIGTKTSAYRKVAAALHAEADAILAAKALEDAHGELVKVENLRSALTATEQRAVAAESDCRRKDREIQQLRSLPAQVVHSGGD